MEQSNKKPRRHFTPEQKYEIIKDIEASPIVRDALERNGITSGLYYKWRHQLTVGINASLRNTKPLKPQDLKKLEEENRKLKEVILSRSMTIARLKKYTDPSLTETPDLWNNPDIHEGEEGCRMRRRYCGPQRGSKRSC